MKKPQTYSVFVIQAGNSPQDIYVGQSWESPQAVLERFSSHNILTPKKLRGHELILRPELYKTYPIFTSQEKALIYEESLAQKLYEAGFHILSKSLNRTKRKKNKKVQLRKKATFKLKDIREGDYRNEAVSKEYKGDIFSYGRKRSNEWNDESALKFQQLIDEKIKQGKIEHESKREL